MSFTQLHFQPISCQYPSKKHATSDHTKWVQVKINSPTSLTVNKIWNLEMRRMSMSRLQNLSPNWRQRHHEQPLGIPGHKRPSRPHRRWDWNPGRCLSRKCSSSKLRLVPGRRESNMEVDQIWHLRDLMKYKWGKTLSFRLRVSKQQFPLDSGQMSLTQRCTSSQYHANIPVESIPHHTTQNEFKSKINSSTSLTANKIRNLDMRRIIMSKLQSLSTNWRQKQHEQPLGIPGHKRPSLPQRRWNWQTGWCLSRKCSSSKLRLVPGRRESDMEVDQIWHPWDLMKYKWDKTLSFRLRVSKEQIPLDSRQMCFTEVHCPPISCQYPSRKHTTSYHTECVQVKKKFTHFTHSRLNLKIWKCEGWAWANYKAFQKAGDKDTMLGIPGHNRPVRPHRRWNCFPGWCLSRRCSSSKLQLVPGKRESDVEVGLSRLSRPRVTSVRPHEIQMRHTLSVSDSEFPKNKSYWIQGKCLWHRDALPANIMPISQ